MLDASRKLLCSSEQCELMAVCRGPAEMGQLLISQKKQLQQELDEVAGACFRKTIAE